MWSRDCEQATNGMAAFVLSGQPNGYSTSNDYWKIFLIQSAIKPISDDILISQSATSLLYNFLRHRSWAGYVDVMSSWHCQLRTHVVHVCPGLLQNANYLMTRLRNLFTWYVPVSFDVVSSVVSYLSVWADFYKQGWTRD